MEIIFGLALGLGAFYIGALLGTAIFLGLASFHGAEIPNFWRTARFVAIYYAIFNLMLVAGQIYLEHQIG